jgi:serine/threonine protein kinase
VKTIGDYEIVRYLTAGGMADLYLARHARHPDSVVVKTIQPRYVEFTRVVKMFVDEGRIAKDLDHPNIVKVLDVGHAEGRSYIAMEFIPGRDLVAICRRGVEVRQFLPRALGVAIVVQALRGLGHAHEKIGSDGKALRIVHCDVSPGNIVVGWGGTAKIVDFGIARATVQLRTEDHTVAGKYSYMAPEQIRGDAVDQRADLFAAGIILYEITVGKRLFRGRPEQVMRKVIDDPIPPPSSQVPDFPPELERIIMRALERDPNQRWQTARQMRSELVGWLAAARAQWDKRAIAEYMRTIFGATAEKLDESEEFGDGSEEALVLDKGVPRTQSGLHELPLYVDPEDPEDTPAVVFKDDATVPYKEEKAARALFRDEVTAPSKKDLPTGPTKLPPPRAQDVVHGDEITGPMKKAPAPHSSKAAKDEITAPRALPRSDRAGRIVVSALVAGAMLAGFVIYLILRG